MGNSPQPIPIATLPSLVQQKEGGEGGSKLKKMEGQREGKRVTHNTYVIKDTVSDQSHSQSLAK
jgi:hypothetical protein